MADAPNANQLLQLIANQQQQIAQLLTLQQNQRAETTLTLPDVATFEPSDDKSRISEWLKRVQFAIDCVSPNAPDAVKVKAIMNKLSESAFSEYTKFCLPESVTTFDLVTTAQKLEKLFAKPQSIFIDRYECLMARRGEGEDFRTFVNRHKRLLTNFKFSDLKEQQFYVLMLLTALKSSNDATLRQRILTKLTADGERVKYDAVVEDCISFMATIADAKAIESSSGTNQGFGLNAINKRKEMPSRGRAKGHQSPKSAQQKCWRCGWTNHHHSECKHKGTKCRKCSHVGHLESRCEAVQEWRKNNSKGGPRKSVGTVHIGTTAKTINKASLLKVKASLNGQAIEFVLDSGAEVNVINEEAYQCIGSPKIKACKEKAVLYDGSTRDFIGKATGTFEFNGTTIEHDFYVAGKESLNLLSMQTMEAFGLLDELKAKIAFKRVNVCKSGNKENKAESRSTATEVKEYLSKVKESFPEVFKEELGQCKKAKANLVLKPGAQPVFRKPRPVPHNSREVVEKELDRLENLGVIKKVEHSEWSAPILIVKKADGSARMCIDYSTGLNNALMDHQHPLPLPNDIFATLNGGKVFSQVDLRDAYLQVELTEESKKLCTIATHRGYYEFSRLPFGVKTAPGIFQSIMDQMLAGLEFATAYLDDVIIVSKTNEEHFRNLNAVFERFQNWGMRVKMEKCTFFQEQIKYFGQVIDKNGRRPSTNKIAAIKEMPAPTDVPSLRTFLGMVNHYQQFVKNMRFVRQPLDELLKKEKEWDWSKQCQGAFTKIKEILSSDLLLTHYDPKLEIIVAADASEHGVGAVISHRFPNGTIKAIEHASSALTPAERNYSQIEKEGLALVFAVRKFHKMIYGRKFILQTDHKPLLTIFGNKKGIRQMSANRLLRWSLFLLAYDFEIEYVNTVDFGQADALSRLIAKGSNAEEERVIATMEIEQEGQQFFVNALETVSLSSKDIITAGNEDETIKKVKKFVKDGWPNEKAMNSESEELKLFFRRKNDLSITKECLMYGERVVIPTKFRPKVLRIIHKGHPGIKRMKQLARKYVYWPKLDSEIENFVQNCGPCQLAAKAPTKTELNSWPKATKAWQRVHMDYAGPFYGKEYLLVVDAFSKYPEVFEMSTKSTAATIGRLRYLFSRHGLPEILVSDNGTQFSSKEFADFVNANGINHYFSAPYNPMSNGQAERFVDSFKRTFRKLKGEGAPSAEIIETFLTSYRTTPLPEGKSPAELFLGRKLRTALDLLRPPKFQPIERDEQMERRFNKRFGAKRREFGEGDKVFARHRISQSWRHGNISKRTGVIYDVKFPDGSINRYHANQLRPRILQDNSMEQLNTFHDVFGLPNQVRVPEEEQQIRQNVAEVEADQNEIGPEDQNEGRPPDGQEERPISPRYPRRNRRPPQRYSPPHR